MEKSPAIALEFCLTLRLNTTKSNMAFPFNKKRIINQFPNLYIYGTFITQALALLALFLPLLVIGCILFLSLS